MIILCVLDLILLLKRMQKKIITIDDKIRDEKLKFNREAAKISIFIDKYKYLAGKQMFLSGQSRMIEQP